MGSRRTPRLSRALTLALFTTSLCAACGPKAATDVAQTLVRQGRDDDAVATLRQRLGTHPDDIPARRLLVRLLGLIGQMDSAQAEVRELKSRLPEDDPAPDIELGHALELSHRYDDALRAYDDAARDAPRSPDGPREGGMRSARWGEPDLARPRLEEAVKRGARDAETMHALGLVRLHMGDEDGAAQAYRACAASDPRDAQCWLGLATVGVVRGDSREALAAYDQVLLRAPRFASAELGRAWALTQLGRTGEALRALDHAEQLGAPAQNVARQRAVLATVLAKGR